MHGVLVSSLEPGKVRLVEGGVGGKHDVGRAEKGGREEGEDGRRLSRPG